MGAQSGRPSVSLSNVEFFMTAKDGFQEQIEQLKAQFQMSNREEVEQRRKIEARMDEQDEELDRLRKRNEELEERLIQIEGREEEKAEATESMDVRLVELEQDCETLMAQSENMEDLVKDDLVDLVTEIFKPLYEKCLQDKTKDFISTTKESAQSP